MTIRKKRATTSRPLTTAEELVLRAYLGAAVPQDALQHAIESFELDGSPFDAEDYPTTLDAAVAEVVLQSVRDELPQWVLASANGLDHGRNKVRPPSFAVQSTTLVHNKLGDVRPGVFLA